MGTKRSINNPAKNTFIYSEDANEQLCILWKIQYGYPCINFDSTWIIACSAQRQPFNYESQGSKVLSEICVAYLTIPPIERPQNLAIPPTK